VLFLKALDPFWLPYKVSAPLLLRAKYGSDIAKGKNVEVLLRWAKY
jgi:hypothetical protein